MSQNFIRAAFFLIVLLRKKREAITKNSVTGIVTTLLHCLLQTQYNGRFWCHWQGAHSGARDDINCGNFATNALRALFPVTNTYGSKEKSMP